MYHAAPGGRRPLEQADQPEPIDPHIGGYSDYIHHRTTQPESLVYRPTEGRGLSQPSWLVSYQDGLWAC